MALQTCNVELNDSVQQIHDWIYKINVACLQLLFLILSTKVIIRMIIISAYFCSVVGYKYSTDI